MLFRTRQKPVTGTQCPALTQTRAHSVGLKQSYWWVLANLKCFKFSAQILDNVGKRLSATYANPYLYLSLEVFVTSNLYGQYLYNFCQ